MLDTARWLSHTKKAAQLDVNEKTLDRWVETGIIDKPDRVNGRKYYREDSQPRRDGECEQTAA